MSSAGDMFENPVTGARVADLCVRPGGAVTGEHVHARIEEWFTGRRGRVGLLEVHGAWHRRSR